MIPGVAALVGAGLNAGIGASDFDVGVALTDGAFEGDGAIGCPEPQPDLGVAIGFVEGELVDLFAEGVVDAVKHPGLSTIRRPADDIEPSSELD